MIATANRRQAPVPVAFLALSPKGNTGPQADELQVLPVAVGEKVEMVQAKEM